MKGILEKLYGTLFTHPGSFGKVLGQTIRDRAVGALSSNLANATAPALRNLIYGGGAGGGGIAGIMGGGGYAPTSTVIMNAVSGGNAGGGTIVMGAGGTATAIGAGGAPEPSYSP